MLRFVTQVTGARGAALIGGGERPAVIESHQVDQEDGVGWHRPPVEAILRGQLKPVPLALELPEPADHEARAAGQRVVLLGLKHRIPHIAAVACLTDRSGHELEELYERLQFAAGVIAEFELRLLVHQNADQIARLRCTCELLDRANAGAKFRGAAMAFCNELASRFDLERVSLGIRRGPYMRVTAASATEQIHRKTDYIQLVEAAMEESADQKEPVIYPSPDGVDTVARAASKLAHHVDARAVCTLPLTQDDRVEMALTIEAVPERVPNIAALEAIQLALNHVGPTLLRRQREDRWVGAKAVAATRLLAAAAIGPRHTWVKLLSLAVIALGLFLVLAKGTYQVEAPFVIEPAAVQMIDAPYDGTLEAVLVEPGDEVEAGDVLARLRTTDLQLELLSLRADRERFAREGDLAMREGRQADRQIALARRDQADAQITRLQSDLDRAEIRSPITGVVMEGDLHERVGGTTQRGEVLMRLMPPQSLRGLVMVGEDQINDIQLNAQGWLAPASDPSLRLPVTVQRIAPIARVEGADNVFPVRVTLESPPQWLAPGMEGVARIDVGERHYAWIWTREAVNWVRMKLWW